MRRAIIMNGFQLDVDPLVGQSLVQPLGNKWDIFHRGKLGLLYSFCRLLHQQSVHFYDCSLLLSYQTCSIVYKRTMFLVVLARNFIHLLYQHRGKLFLAFVFCHLFSHQRIHFYDCSLTYK